MRLQWLALLACLTVTTVTSAQSDTELRKYVTQPAADWLLDPRPENVDCRDRSPGHPTSPTTYGDEKYSLTRLDELRLLRSELPALTVTANPGNRVVIEGSDRKDLRLGYCARANGEKEKDARDLLSGAAMTRRGTMVSLEGPNGPDSSLHRWSVLHVETPRDQPIVIHANASVRVRGMKASLRVSATGRLTILEHAGQLDAVAELIDYSGASGRVILSANMEMHMKITDVRFDGSLEATAGGPVRVLIPTRFRTPFKAVVNRTEDFICRADICSQVKSEKQGTRYLFTYSGEASADPDRFQLRSEESTVVIDNTPAQKSTQR